jgi:hypothetical protein
MRRSCARNNDQNVNIKSVRALRQQASAAPTGSPPSARIRARPVLCGPRGLFLGKPISRYRAACRRIRLSSRGSWRPSGRSLAVLCWRSCWSTGGSGWRVHLPRFLSRWWARRDAQPCVGQDDRAGRWQAPAVAGGSALPPAAGDPLRCCDGGGALALTDPRRCHRCRSRWLRRGRRDAHQGFPYRFSGKNLMAMTGRGGEDEISFLAKLKRRFDCRGKS